MVVLSSTAPMLAAYQALLPPFIESLLDLGASERIALLNPEGVVNLAKAGGDVLSFPTLPAVWPGPLVAAHLMSTARSRQLDSLEVSYIDVLAALLPYALEESRGEWSNWLRDNKDYLYVALCDEELCGPVTAALKPFFAMLKDDALPTFSTLLSSLRMVCDNAPLHCSKVATDFLVELFDAGEPFDAALRTMVNNMDAPMREAFPTFVAHVEA